MNKPPIGRRWRPGQSGNPRGRPPSLKNLSRDHVEEVANMLVMGTFADLKKTAKSKTCSPLVTLIANALVGAARRQEFRTLNQVLNWVIGKPRKFYD